MHPFKVGDIVYTTSHGKVEVTALTMSGTLECKSLDSRYPNVGVIYYTNECSFSPWPEPNHVRPIEDGLYTIIYEGGDFVTVVRHQGGSWYWITAAGGTKPLTRSRNIQIVKRISD